MCARSSPLSNATLAPPRRPAAYHSKARLFFRLARSVDGDDDRVRKFLRVLALRDADAPVLRFWTAGLSRPYRAQLLQRAGA